MAWFFPGSLVGSRRGCRHLALRPDLDDYREAPWSTTGLCRQRNAVSITLKMHDTDLSPWLRGVWRPLGQVFPDKRPRLGWPRS